MIDRLDAWFRSPTEASRLPWEAGSYEQDIDDGNAAGDNSFEQQVSIAHLPHQPPHDEATPLKAGVRRVPVYPFLDQQFRGRASSRGTNGVAVEMIESLSYETAFNEPLLKETSEAAERRGVKRCLEDNRPWASMGLVAFFTGLSGYLLEKGSKWIVRTRNDAIFTDGEGFQLLGCLAYITFNAVLVAGAAALALFWAPGSIGSGIPEVKGYLNGIRLRNIFTVKVFLSKLIGVTLAYSSGLMVGPEGPMVHIGAMVGYFFSPQNDASRRDFVSIGSAAGFAVAFGAPIGGVLFAFEEACSFWSTKLMWRALTTTLASTLSFLLLGNSLSGSDDADFSWSNINTGLLSLKGTKESTMMEIPLFILIGVVGGLVGSLFNTLWARKMKRCKTSVRLNRPLDRLALVVAISVLSSVLFYSIPAIFGNSVCRPRHRFMKDANDELSQLWMRFGCSGDDVNVAASVFFGDRAEAMRSFLEYPHQFHALSLAVMLCVFFPLTVLSFCQDLPGGIFLPTIMTGSTGGALIGKLVSKVLFAYGSSAEAKLMQHCALIGAVSLLGGIMRSTISLCVIIMEGTGQTELLLPVVITTMVSRKVGNMITDGLYEISMLMKQLPFLAEDSLAKESLSSVETIMSRPAKTVCMFPRVDAVVHLLTSTRHHSFPVIDEHNHFRGLVMRSMLTTLVKQHQTRYDGSLQLDGFFVVDSDESGEEVHLAAANDSMQSPTSLDLTRVMDRGPYLCSERCPIGRAYRMFLALSLRHLVVVDSQSRVVGMITRKDLIKHGDELNKEEACKQRWC